MDRSPKSIVKPGTWWQNAWHAWDRFWFRPGSPLTLSFMRIFAGLVIFYIHLNYSFSLQSFMGANAWIDIETINQTRHSYLQYSLASDWTSPEQIIARGWHWFSIFYHVVDPTGVLITHVIIVAATFFFMIGFCTRVSAVVAWIGAVSYVQRSPTTYFGMDTIIVVMLFYSMFAPMGEMLSVDRWLVCRRARRRGQAPPPVRSTVTANFVTRLFQVHFCFVYLPSGLSKLLGPAWWTGTAVWWTMVNYSFSPMDWPVYVGMMKLLSEYLIVWQTFVFLGAYFTLFMEISFVFLIWNPRWRPILVSGSLLLHVGIGLMMGLSTFSASMMAFVLCFIPPKTIQEYLDAWQRRFRKWKEAIVKTPDRVVEVKREEPALTS